MTLGRAEGGFQVNSGFAIKKVNLRCLPFGREPDDDGDKSPETAESQESHTRQASSGLVMPSHSLELLHPTDPPGPRSFRLVLLLVLVYVFLALVVG